MSYLVGDNDNMYCIFGNSYIVGWFTVCTCMCDVCWMMMGREPGKVVRTILVSAVLLILLVILVIQIFKRSLRVSSWKYMMWMQNALLWNTKTVWFDGSVRNIFFSSSIVCLLFSRTANTWRKTCINIIFHIIII